MNKTSPQPRPFVTEFGNAVDFLRDMIAFRRHHEPSFSIHHECSSLRRVSSTLVSLILAGKRRITLDRVDELATLMRLTRFEREAFHALVQRSESLGDGQLPQPASDIPRQESRLKRRLTAPSLLHDWVNAYVKDSFQLDRVKRDASQVFHVLSGLASRSRIEKSMNFLFRHGYLRKGARGETVEDSALHAVDPQVPSAQIRAFHRAALKIAMVALERYPTTRRMANTMIMPLDDRGYADLLALLSETSERLQKFAESRPKGHTLYQVIINISPAGGTRDKT